MPSTLSFPITVLYSSDKHYRYCAGACSKSIPVGEESILDLSVYSTAENEVGNNMAIEAYSDGLLSGLLPGLLSGPISVRLVPNTVAVPMCLKLPGK